MSRRGSGAWAQQHWGPACENAPKRRVAIAPGVNLSVHTKAVEAFLSLAAVIRRHRYAVRPGDTGTYNCRPTTGGTAPSLHSWALAIDINWNTNPFRKDLKRVTDMPEAMVADIKRIRTRQGVPVFEWGGDWTTVKDWMHYAIIATPDELAVGIDWSTVAQARFDPQDPSTWPILKEKTSGPSVTQLQEQLTRAGFAVQTDGMFGPKTKAAVVVFQRSRGLKPDGVVGLQTWTALLSDQPALKAGDPSPVKRRVELQPAEQKTGARVPR